MNWKTLYERNKDKKYKEIEKVNKDFTLKTNTSYIYNKYKYIILLAFILLIFFIILRFYNSFKGIISSFILVIMLLGLMLFFNLYKVVGKNNKMIVKYDIQEIIIDYNNLKNIYIEEKVSNLFFKKIYRYFLVIVYETNTKNISDIILPTFFLNIKDANKFINNFTLKESKENYIEKAKIRKVKRELIKICLFVVFLLLILITYII